MATNTDPGWYQNMVAANATNHDIIADPGGPYQIRSDDITSNTIVMCAGGNDEMLKISPNGFWVRGVKVEQDEREAKAVYEGFKAWMTWASLNGRY